VAAVVAVVAVGAVLVARGAGAASDMQFCISLAVAVGAIGVCSVASVWAIAISTSAATGSGVCSASAFASASKQETVASQWPRFTSEAARANASSSICCLQFVLRMDTQHR